PEWLKVAMNLATNNPVGAVGAFARARATSPDSGSAGASEGIDFTRPAPGPSVFGNPYTVGSKGAAKSRRALPDFASGAADELRATIEAVAGARREFEAWAAQLSGPVADANYQFAVDMEKLNELARKGEVSAQDLA